MQNYVPRKKYYHTIGPDESEYSKGAYERYAKLCLYKKLRAESCSEETALEAIGMPRSTYFRWCKRYKAYGLAGLEKTSKRPNNLRKSQWTKKTESLVLKARRKYPLWGKAKIAVIIKREKKVEISVSTVGRILKKLIGQDKVKPVAFMFGKVKKKPRIFKGHAKRLPYGMKSTGPGELVQVDHMTIEINGKVLKHFKAICPFTKVVTEQVYRRATSISAANFLGKMRQDFPFQVKSVQVDWGSEFMCLFEERCKEIDLPLYVLPPRRPQYNGNVERGNSTAKYEFYSQYHGPNKLDVVRGSLQKFVKFYNEIRPHQALQYLTPSEFCSQIGIRP